MYTAMALVALTMGNLTPSPAWLDDYRAAQAKVTVAGKPMAVFVGTGKDGYQAAVRDGFDPAVSKLLAEKFVCLYVDSSTPKGKALAAAFLALVSPGDEVVVFQPVYDAYLPLIRRAGGTPVLVTLQPPHWRFDEAMREALPWIASQLGPGVSAAVDGGRATPAVPASRG